MCGIAGAFGADLLDRSRIEAALGSLRRRGPDARGWYQDRIGPAAATLLHTRLAIIDLDQRANQPFVRDGIALVFNGEIYNYLEIRTELESRGTQFLTRSDTEVLLEAYRSWGIGCLDRLEGMWAFALLDKAAGKLILSRDRFGEKPLFYMQKRGTLYFASEPKTIAQLLGCRLAVNLRHLRRYLASGYRSVFKTEETFFEDLREVPPATAMTFDLRGGSVSKRYWTLMHIEQDVQPHEAAEGIRERLHRSLQLRLRADVPLAFCLSGGVDSTALVSIAAQELGVPVHAFSVIDQDERYNEYENISITVAAHCRDHYTAHTSTKAFFERMRALVHYHDAPLPTISYYVHSFLSEAIAERGFKVVISGTGADELFTGYYDHYAFWLAEQAHEPHCHTRLIEWQSTYGRWVDNPLLKDPLLFYEDPSFRGHLYPNRELFDGFLVEPIAEPFAEESYSPSLLRNRMMNELRHEIVPVILRADDMNSMRVSIENRSPYLDRELVEFAYRLPNDVLIRDGLPKWPLREAVRGIAPEAVRLDSRKRGFNASIKSLIDCSNIGTRDELLADSPIFEIVRRNSIKDFLEGDMTSNSFSKFLFSFVSAKLFLEANTTTSVHGSRWAEIPA